jgi:hypothetical protein
VRLAAHFAAWMVPLVVLYGAGQNVDRPVASRAAFKLATEDEPVDVRAGDAETTCRFGDGQLSR